MNLETTENPTNCYYRSQLLNSTASVNPLIAAATSIFSIATSLEQGTPLDDQITFLQNLTHEIKAFENKAQLTGYRSNIIYQARFALCCLLDTVIKQNEWDKNHSWEQNSLLHLFYQESYDHSKFFAIIERAIKDPTDNLELLELFYICLSLGFDSPHVIDDLYKIIKNQRNEQNKNLLVQDRSPAIKLPQKSKLVPSSIMAFLTVIFANLILYWSFNTQIMGKMAPIYATLKQHITLAEENGGQA